jgi:hypothetical protein
MNESIESHPSEDVLIEYAMGARDPGIQHHVDWCPQCRAFVDDMKSVRQSLAAIDDEEVPLNLGKRLAKTGALTKFPSWVDAIILNWFRNPIVLTIGFLLYILLMYLMVAYLGGLSGEITR